MNRIEIFGSIFIGLAFAAGLTFAVIPSGVPTVDEQLAYSQQFDIEVEEQCEQITQFPTHEETIFWNRYCAE